LSTVDNNCLQWPPLDAAVAFASVAEDRFYHLTSVVSEVARLMTVLNYSNHFSGSLVKTSIITPAHQHCLDFTIVLGLANDDEFREDTLQTHSLRRSGSSLLTDARRRSCCSRLVPTHRYLTAVIDLVLIEI